MMTRHWRPAAVAAGMTLLTSCGLTGQATTQSAELSEWFTVSSPAFRDGGQIPARFGCPSYGGGPGKTPPLRWSGAPTTTKAFAIVTDAPDAPEGAAVLWLIANIDGTTHELVEGARPEKAVEGQNTFQKIGYTPPCPTRREQQRYRFTIYALGERVQMPQGAPLKDSLTDIAKQTIGRGRITGNFGGA